MEKNNNKKSLFKENKNIFYKIKNIFLIIFMKVKLKDGNIRKNPISMEIKENNSKSDFYDTLKATINEKKDVLFLQKEYEKGNLKANEMTKEEYEKIKELYKNQIEELENQINNKKLKLANNKET